MAWSVLNHLWSVTTVRSLAGAKQLTGYFGTPTRMHLNPLTSSANRNCSHGPMLGAGADASQIAPMIQAEAIAMFSQSVQVLAGAQSAMASEKTRGKLIHGNFK